MRFWELGKRNLKETYRDPLALAFLLGFPLVFMLLFGAIFSGDTISNYPIGVIDDDNTLLSQAFVNEALTNAPTIKVVAYEETTIAMEDLKLGDIRAFIVIPEGFGEQVSQNWQGEDTDIALDITYDESDLMVSKQIISTVNVATRTFARIEIPVTINTNPIHRNRDNQYRFHSAGDNNLRHSDNDTHLSPHNGAGQGKRIPVSSADNSHPTCGIYSRILPVPGYYCHCPDNNLHADRLAVRNGHSGQSLADVCYLLADRSG